MTWTRRRLLGRGSVVLATAALAGCPSGSETGTDGDGEPTTGEGDRTTAPATPTATLTGTGPATGTPAGEQSAADLAGFTDWLPAPSTIEFVPDTGYAFRAVAAAGIRDFSDALPDSTTADLQQQIALPGIETLADATTFLQFARSAFLYTAAFDRGAVEEEFQRLGVTPVGDYRGFTVLTASDPRAAAVGDDAVLTVDRFSSTDTVDKRPAVEAVIDARTGNGPRYTGAIPDCDRLVDALGPGHHVTGRTHEVGATFDGAVGEGTSTHVGSTDTRVRASVIFDETADEDALAAWVGDAPVFAGTDPTTAVDGRVVTADTAVPTGELTAFPPAFPGPEITESPPSRLPQVAFGFEYESTGDGRGRLTVTHEAGDSVSADQLFLRGQGFADVAGVDQTSQGPWQGEASGDGGRVVAGDSAVAGVTSDYQVSVQWESADGGVDGVFASDQGPDA